MGSFLGRRDFLRLTGFGAGMLALSHVRFAPAALAATIPASGLRVLTAGDARILAALAERITFTGDAAMPRFAGTDGLRTIDTALLQLPPDVPEQLSWALWLVEYGPPLCIGKPARFTGLDAGWQDIYLTDWAESRFQIRRLVFQAVKNLSMLGYYAQDATWPGIHYGGPWAPRPRRVVPNV
ncbi:MAG: hypothetical protein ABI629_03350 [bacterium]